MDIELYKFTIDEFESPDKPGSGINMNRELLETLSSIRKHLNRPMIINSGYRTSAHNEKVDGGKDSSHMFGLAVDIHVLDSRFRFDLIRLAIEHGINRIGVYRTFIHLDIDKSKPDSVMWYV